MLASWLCMSIAAQLVHAGSTEITIVWVSACIDANMMQTLRNHVGCTSDVCVPP